MTSRTIHGGAILLAVCVLAYLTAGCGGAIDSSPPPTTVPPRVGGHLAVGLESDPNGIDPVRNAWDPAALSVANAIFDPWMAWDATGAVTPYLAESLQPNADFTVWTLKIRPGVTFHDGTPLDADATITWWTAVTKSVITGPAVVYDDHFEKVDPLTVKIYLKRPWASMAVSLTTQGGYIAAPSQLDDPDGTVKPVGTGPFKLRQWKIGERVTVEKNTAYWRKGLPYLDSVEFVVTPDGAQRVKDLVSGSLDVVYATHPSETAALARVGTTAGITVEHDPGATDAEFLMFNTAAPPFDDLRVRQAIAYATDVDALAAADDWPRARLTKGPFAPGSPFYADVDYPRYEPERAKALVREYEAEKGPISFAISVAFEAGTGQQLADQWAKVGIEATESIVDFKRYVIDAVAGHYQAVLFRYFAAQDPDALWHFWTSETARPVGQVSLNFTRLADPQIDTNLTLGRTAPEPEVRKEAYRVVQQRFADQLPYVWLYRTDWTIARRDQVHDAKNVTLPDGRAALPYDGGVFRATETWVAAPTD